MENYTDKQLIDKMIHNCEYIESLLRESGSFLDKMDNQTMAGYLRPNIKKVTIENWTLREYLVLDQGYFEELEMNER